MGKRSFISDLAQFLMNLLQVHAEWLARLYKWHYTVASPNGDIITEPVPILEVTPDRGKIQ